MDFIQPDPDKLWQFAFTSHFDACRFAHVRNPFTDSRADRNTNPNPRIPAPGRSDEKV
jgi:hypothetical protein